MFAGLSTGIGGLLAIVTKKTNTRFLALSLGFSAGVMLYVSFVEIFSKARDSLSAVFWGTLGYWYTTGAFFGGILFAALIDSMIPSHENPHEIHGVEHPKFS